MSTLAITTIEFTTKLHEDGNIIFTTTHEDDADPEGVEQSKMICFMHLLVESARYVREQHTVEIPPDLMHALTNLETEFSRNGID